MRKTYWAYTDQSLFELIVGNEDRDVWKINLQKENFDVALRYAKVMHHQNFCRSRPDIFGEQTAGQRDLIFASHAQALLKTKRYFPAAQAFAQCSIPFEDVALKFLDVNERDALRSYLMLRLEQTRKSVRVRQFFILLKLTTKVGCDATNDACNMAC